MENAVSVVSLPQVLARFAHARADLAAPLTYLDFPLAHVLEEPRGRAVLALPAPLSSLEAPLAVVRDTTFAAPGTHPPHLRSRDGVEMLTFATPHAESFRLVASPEMRETKIHFLCRKRAKISPEVQPPALATSSINSLCSQVLLCLF